MVKTAVYLLAFYLIYFLFLSRDTAYTRNRIFILLSVTLSIVLPFISLTTIRPMEIQNFGKLLSDVFVKPTTPVETAVDQGFDQVKLLSAIYSIYITGVALFLVKLVLNHLSLFKLITRQNNNNTRIIKFDQFNTSGFSTMGYIFINSSLSPEEEKDIINHEENHLSKHHYLDILYIEIIKAFQWFNPIVYLFNRSIRAIHEFQADEGCINSGVPIVNYQNLLLRQVFKTRSLNLTNSFSNPSMIKKRMVMMSKKRTSALSNLKLFLVVPVTIVVFLAISAYKGVPEFSLKSIGLSKIDVPEIRLLGSVQKGLIPSNKPSVSFPAEKLSGEELPSDTENTAPDQLSENKTGDAPISTEKVSENPIPEETPFVVVEEMPMFPGGDAALLKYIHANSKYPENAKANEIEGRVIVRFSITPTGGVDNVSVLKGVDPELDKEAIRVVKTLPEFKPGRQGGKAVPVWYMVPITFTLK